MCLCSVISELSNYDRCLHIDIGLILNGDAIDPAKTIRKLAVYSIHVYRLLCNMNLDIVRVSYIRGLPTCKMLIRKMCIVL